ncbi:MAG: hypothetical protein WCY29_13545 [Novosphingobium sp.]
MAQAIRYRSGVDRQSGRMLTGSAHLAQSLDTIWSTRIDELVMLLDFGSDLRGLLAEDLTPALALSIFNELVVTAERWEPEYRVDELQFVRMSEAGMLGLRHGGLYYPEGRFGNYGIAIPFRAAPARFGRGAL